jgi:DNA-binding beta-propeller fold protein YncE
VTLQRVVPLESPSAIVLSNDSKLLIVGNGDYVEFLDTARMNSGQGDPRLGRIYGGERATEAYVQVTADDRFLLVSDHGRETVTVYKLDQARSANFNGDFKLGTIPVGRAPLVSIFSPDQRFLYIVSEFASSKSTWPRACGQNPEGVVDVVDVERARTQPETAVLASVKAGCVPVRLALSPNGDRAYVTARSDNRMLVFDTAKMRTDVERARIAAVPVGSTPVGLAVINNGSRIVVTASRGDSPSETQDLTVIDAARVASGAASVLGTIPAGNSPRETSPTSDGRTLILNNFNSDTLQLIDLTRLPMKAAGSSQ